MNLPLSARFHAIKKPNLFLLKDRMAKDRRIKPDLAAVEESLSLAKAPIC
jgi:hypothetical protein